jgi:hypothetical protein
MNKNASKKYGEVVRFLSEETGTAVHRISPRTDIVRHLRVAGDDGVELIDKFAEKFDVDMRGFIYSDYFGTEGFNPFVLFSPSFWKELRSRNSITVADLVEAAESGAWLSRKRSSA